MKTCFLMMPFDEQFQMVFHDVIEPALTANNCQYIRADEQSDPIIYDGIINGIKLSHFCIADLTGFNKNVLYEIGISHSSNKPTIIITQDNPESLPFDLKHYRVIQYNLLDFENLKQRLTSTITNILALGDLPTSLLQNMLIPSTLKYKDDKSKFFIATCPITWREAKKQGSRFKFLRNTYGDYVGIRDLIQDFGSISGLDFLPELINTGDFEDEVALQKANIYCISGPKSNQWTKILLEEFCKDKSPKFSFKPDINSEDLRNVQLNIYMDKDRYLPPNWNETEHRYERDFGLIIRGPHPRFPNCMIMILAGRGAIGTEAACRAVTLPGFIKKIKDRLDLESIDINDFSQSFWAVISAKTTNHKNEENSKVLDLNSFRVVDVKAFEL